MRIIMFIALACMAWAAHAEVPHIFQPGQPARAADVNQNFKHLSDKTDQSINNFITGLGLDGTSDEMTGEALCPAGSIPINANCLCVGDGTTRNFGVLFACSLTAQGAIGGCFEDTATYNPALPWPETRVSALCAAVGRHDGTVLTQAMGMDTKIHADDHGEALNRLREQITIRRTLINQ